MTSTGICSPTVIALISAIPSPPMTIPVDTEILDLLRAPEGGDSVLLKNIHAAERPKDSSPTENAGQDRNRLVGRVIVNVKVRDQAGEAGAQNGD